MKHLPKLVFAGLVFALLLFALGSCKSMGRAAKSTGGGSIIAIIFLFTPFPWAAIPVAALSGHVGAELQRGDDLKDEIKEEVQKQVKIVYRDVPFIPDVVRWSAWALAAWLLFRFRAGVLAFLRSLLTGGIKASLLTLGGLLWGGDVADVAKEHVAAHEALSPRARALRRLRIPIPPFRPPTVQTGQEQRSHDV